MFQRESKVSSRKYCLHAEHQKRDNKRTMRHRFSGLGECVQNAELAVPKTQLSRHRSSRCLAWRADPKLEEQHLHSKVSLPEVQTSRRSAGARHLPDLCSKPQAWQMRHRNHRNSAKPQYQCCVWNSNKYNDSSNNIRVYSVWDQGKSFPDAEDHRSVALLLKNIVGPIFAAGHFQFVMSLFEEPVRAHRELTTRGRARRVSSSPMDSMKSKPMIQKISM